MICENCKLERELGKCNLCEFSGYCEDCFSNTHAIDDNCSRIVWPDWESLNE